MTGPREGLPPCLSLAVFEGRRAFMRDFRKCGHGSAVVVNVGPVLDRHPDLLHRDFMGFYADASQLEWKVSVTDPTEGEVDDLWLEAQERLRMGQATFAEGAEWVRTGEGP